MGMAEAVECKGGVGDDDMPAGEAMEVGNMKSSMFIASGSEGLFDMSTDWRSFAIPEGLLVFRC